MGSTFVTGKEGDLIKDITCTAECVPECTYEWYFKGSRIRDDHTLDLEELERAEDGLYSCNATNSRDDGQTYSSSTAVNITVYCKMIVPASSCYNIAIEKTLKIFQ